MSLRLDGPDSSKRELLYLAADGGEELCGFLQASGWNALVARGVDEARRLTETRPLSLGLVDVSRLGTGSALLALAEACPTSMHWIALLRPDDLEQREVCAEVSRLCYDYHTVPVDLARLRVTLGRAFGMARLRRRQRAFNDSGDKAMGLVGESEAIRALRHGITRLAASEAPVLITGDSGTGKELTALALHRFSERHDGPFVPVNCGALPASLIQSELFGYERGAFSGADRRVIGKIESANGGTLFLDEIGDLPPQLQVNLLRVLQERNIQRVGGHRDILLDLRILAATHVDLERAVAEGRFREDLYYRLNVLNLKVPPLRDRIEDVELLAQHIFETHPRERHPGLRGFSPKALKAMRLHRWPGNVRELVNRVLRAMIVADRSLITADDLGLGHLLREPSDRSLEQIRADAEIDALTRSLACCSGNISLAAKQLGVSRATLYRLIDKHGLQTQNDAARNDTVAPPEFAPRKAPTKPPAERPCIAASAAEAPARVRV